MATSRPKLNGLSDDNIRSISQWNATPQQKISDLIHGCIARIGHRNPHNVAVEGWDGTLTFEQLDTRAEGLARYVNQLGFGVSDTAAVIMNKSIQVPIAMLAVMKSGGAFTLFDSKLPFTRLATMRDVAECRYAIVQPQHIGLASRLFDTVIAMNDNGEIVAVETDNSECVAASNSRSLRQPSVDDTAFLVFTSGSSGVPKAVEIAHSAWASTYTGHQEKFGIQQASRVLQLSSQNFILSYLEILATLMVGGTVCIPSLHEQQHDLGGVVQRLKPDWVSMTPSLARASDPRDFQSISTLVLVGELVPASTVQAWSMVPKLLNGYGQSEACSMNSTCQLQSDGATVSRSIGRSTWVTYWVVDPEDHNKLMPVGEIGELLVEGHAIAKGYRNDIAKTREAFVEKPSWADCFNAGQDGRRFYKTGDLVQYQQDGSLCLFGRKDAQLKIRGQRLAALEVEHHITILFGNEIRQVIVEKTKTHFDSETERLTAFVVLQEGIATGEIDGANEIHALKDQPHHAMEAYLADLLTRMRAQLETRLPDWMIPTALSVLRAAPRTVTGKLSRRLLSEQEILCSTDQRSRDNNIVISTKDGDEATMDAAAREQDARSRVARSLAHLWAKVLHVDIAAINSTQTWSNFEGDSLAALTLVREARNAGFLITLKDVLSGQSFEEMVSSLEKQKSGTKLSGKVPRLDATDVKTAVAQLTDFQAHCVRVTARAPQSLVYSYDIRLRGDFDLERLARAIKAVVVNTDSLRLRFNVADERSMTQSVVSSTNASLAKFVEVSDINDGSTSSTSSPILLPFLAKIRKGSHALEASLSLRVHHAVFDGTSVKLILEDIIQAYNKNSPPEKRPHYWDYLNARLLKRSPLDYDYWRNLLAGLAAPTFLRAPRESLMANTGSLTDIHFSRTLALDTRTLPPGVTLATLLKAAWAIVLAHLSGTTDVVFGYLVHGRDERIPESQHIIGCCGNDVPCRVKLDEHVTSSQLLLSVSRQILESIPFAHVGSATIARECTNWTSTTGTATRSASDGQVFHYSSWLLHQNFDEVKHLGIGSEGYMDIPEPTFGGELLGDFGVITFPYGSQAVKVLILTHSQFYREKEILAVWKAYRLCITALLAGIDVLEIRKRLESLQHLPMGSLL